jgi:hypothetical protein
MADSANSIWGGYMDEFSKPVCPLCGEKVDQLVPFGKGKVCQTCFAKHETKLSELVQSGFYDGFDESDED